MTRQADAARLFAADHDAALFHFAVDPFEAHGRGHQFQTQAAAHAVEQGRRRDGADHATRFVTVFHHVLHQQRDDAVRVHEVAVLVAGPNAVGVAIVDEHRIVAEFAHFRQATIHPRRNRLGMQAVERGIGGVVDLAHLHPHVAQEAGQVAAPRSVERIDNHPQMGGTDGLCVHQVLERIQIGAHEVDFLEGPAPVPGVGGKLRLHAVGEFLGAGAAVGHAQLHAQVLCRVVAAGQHDAADGVLVVRHRPAQGRRGTVVLRQLDVEAMGRGNLGGQLGVGVRVLPAVVPDDQGSGRVGGAPGRRSLFLEHARGRVDDAHDVVVREAFANDGTPSVGAEMYVFHKVPFHALGSTRTPPVPSQAACRSAALAALRHARARQDHDTA